MFGYGYKGVGLRKTSMLIPTPPEAPGYVNHPPWSDLQTGGVVFSSTIETIKHKIQPILPEFESKIKYPPLIPPPTKKNKL